MKVAIEKIGPTKAKAYLKLSDNIRRPNKRKIGLMIKDMKSGNWEDNGHTIKFYQNGSGESLIDGQNRLHAVVSSGVAQNFVVVRGIDSEKYVDVGEKRTLAQLLHHDGWAYAACHAATVGNILSMKWFMTHPDSMGRPDVSQSDRIRTFEQHKSKLKTLVPTASNQKGLLWKATVIAVLSVGTTTRSYSAAKDDFIYYLGTGEDMPKSDPVWKLREIQYSDHRKKGHRMSQRQRLGLTIKAWNAHRDEQGMSELRFRSAGPTMEKFPKIK